MLQNKSAIINNIKKKKMKTKLFISIALVLFSVNIFAKNNIRKEVTLIENTTEEIVIYDDNTDQPIKKHFNLYNENGQLISKTLYAYKLNNGWIPCLKYEYSYSDIETRTPSTIKYTKWDMIRKCWEKNSKTTQCYE